MRFRLKSLFVFLLCSLAHYSYAGEYVPVLRADNMPITTPTANKDEPAVIEADSLTGKKEEQIEAIGNVTIRQGGQSISADHLLYQQGSQELEAQGSVVLKRDGNTMSGPHLQLNLDNSSGTMEQPQFYLGGNNAHGSAEVLQIQDREHYSLDNATYTTCPVGNQDWQLNMGLLELDQERQIGVARNASVEFKGVPFLYTPWMDFPLNDQRKSGFMAPVFGGTSQGGTEVTLPYYWNIAPNQDATFAPRIMRKRGLMLNNEYRYLSATFGGELHYDTLPNDAVSKSNRERFALKHSQALANGVNAYVNFNRVSDDAYFRDLGDAVNTTSQVNLPREGGINFNLGAWNGFARVQRFQT
ncbi:MAG TPA: LPS assembly protein LptD, partial [Gallionella sp.]|nr:LPS assembly protein LptD [Gallionella sp.]